MRNEPIANYIWFGLTWRYLQDARAGFPIHGPGCILENLDVILRELARFELNVTLRASYDLVQLQKELASLLPGSTLTAEQANKLETTMRDLQRTLQAEGKGNIAYIITDKRLDVRKLIDHPEGLFAPEVFRLLPQVAKYDFAEAGLCIAFERPTAAAFHLLRGTEDVLRTFYCAVVKRGRVPSLLWGQMTDSLRQRRTKPPAELLQNLDNIRFSFRNPTQHPEKIYDIREAQDLFGLCVDVVNRMVRSKVWIDTA